MSGNLTTRGVPHGKEFRHKTGWPGDPSVVAAKLHEDENKNAEEKTDGRDV